MARSKPLWKSSPDNGVIFWPKKVYPIRRLGQPQRGLIHGNRQRPQFKSWNARYSMASVNETHIYIVGGGNMNHVVIITWSSCFCKYHCIPVINPNIQVESWVVISAIIIPIIEVKSNEVSVVFTILGPESVAIPRPVRKTSNVVPVLSPYRISVNWRYLRAYARVYKISICLV